MRVRELQLSGRYREIQLRMQVKMLITLGLIAIKRIVRVNLISKLSKRLETGRQKPGNRDCRHY